MDRLTAAWARQGLARHIFTRVWKVLFSRRFGEWEGDAIVRVTLNPKPVIVKVSCSSAFP